MTASPHTGHSFQCSSCGAPVLPRGASAVIRCPYCQNSVVVPEALRHTATPWTTSLFDGFVSNENNWQVGTEQSEFFAPLVRTMADGRYRWDAVRAKAPSTATASLAGYHVEDFHYLVNAKHISGSKIGSSWGVTFRVQNYLNFYVFRITDNQLFTAAVVKDGEWESLHQWSRSSAIRPNGVNQLAVVAHEEHFVLSINNQVVYEFDDYRFDRGLVGLAIEVYTIGEKTIFDFLDVTLRAP